MSNPDLSIVIPTYNSIDKMSETLDSLVRTMDLVDGEVVFVDDCSKDDTYDPVSYTHLTLPTKA